MAAKKTDSNAESTIVKIKDADGRVHYTARGSSAHKRFETAGGKAEAVEDNSGSKSAGTGGGDAPAVSE